MPTTQKIELGSQEKRQEGYRQLYQQINPEWEDSLKLLCKLFKPLLRPKMVILDAGCGRANFVVEQFRKSIDKAVGIDVSPKETEGNVILDQIVYGQLENLPFANESFDVVLSQWVLEHLESPAEVFCEIFRVLKKKGALVFITPYKFSYLLLPRLILPKRLLRALVGMFYGRGKPDVFATHYRANTPRRIEKMLARVGFEKHELILNNDPTYLAFNKVTFCLARLIEKAARFLPFHLNQAHIIGVFIKL